MEIKINKISKFNYRKEAKVSDVSSSKDNNEIMITGKNFDDSDILLEKTNIIRSKLKTPIPVYKLQTIPEKMTLKENLIAIPKKEITNAVGFQRISKIFQEKIIPHTRVRSKFSSNSLLNKTILTEEIFEKDKIKMKKKSEKELYRYNIRKSVYLGLYNKRNESFDKTKRNKAFLLTKSDETIVNKYLNKIKLYTTMIFIFIIINLTLNVVDISLFTNEIDKNLNSFFKSNETRNNYHLKFRTLHY